MSLRGRWGRLRVDVTPLRESRDFRPLFWAGTVFYLGGMVSHVALTAAWLRDFWAYDARTDEYAVRERAVRARSDVAEALGAGEAQVAT